MFESIHPITITIRAAEEIRKIMRTKNIPADHALRIGIRGSGCGGASLMVGFDVKHEWDVSYEIAGIPVYIDKRHTMYVAGKEIDFYDGADKRGFMLVDAEEM